jgi:RNA-directed DNA polymerase
VGQPRHLEETASPVRRGFIPQAGTTEQRPLGMPTLAERAQQSWVAQALEPAGEAQCEPNSEGFRPGRSPWEASGAIDVPINQQPKWGLAADIAQCFARLDHAALVRTRHAAPPLSRQINAWRTSGLRDQGGWFPTEAGTPPGGPVSPL